MPGRARSLYELQPACRQWSLHARGRPTGLNHHPTPSTHACYCSAVHHTGTSQRHQPSATLPPGHQTNTSGAGCLLQVEQQQRSDGGRPKTDQLGMTTVYICSRSIPSSTCTFTRCPKHPLPQATHPNKRHTAADKPNITTHALLTWHIIRLYARLDFYACNPLGCQHT